MSTGGMLLAALDATFPPSNASIALGSAEAQRQAAGLAAISPNEVLIAHGYSWNEVASAPNTRLAKICGHLGSRYEAERKAAYNHSVHLLLHRNVCWSDLVWQPSGLPLFSNRIEHLAEDRLCRQHVGELFGQGP
jgi:hypothetical protein